MSRLYCHDDPRGRRSTVLTSLPTPQIHTFRKLRPYDSETDESSGVRNFRPFKATPPGHVVEGSNVVNLNHYKRFCDDPGSSLLFSEDQRSSLFRDQGSPLLKLLEIPPKTEASSDSRLAGNTSKKPFFHIYPPFFPLAKKITSGPALGKLQMMSVLCKHAPLSLC